LQTDELHPNRNNKKKEKNEKDLKTQIEALRDSGKIVHLYGTLLSTVPDYNGSQIQVDRIEVKDK
jgi:hypothetical protein